MKSALSSLTSERERLKQSLDHETCPPTSPQVVGLKNALATVRGKAHFFKQSVANTSHHAACHAPHQVWHIDEPFRGITRRWCVKSVYVNEITLNSHVSSRRCLPPGFLFYFLPFSTHIVMLTSFATLQLLCSLRQHISLSLNILLGARFFFNLTQPLPTPPHTGLTQGE